MKIKSVITTALASVFVITGVAGAAHIRRLEVRLTSLENAQKLHVARTKVLIRDMDVSGEYTQLNISAKFLAAVLEPEPSSAMRAMRELSFALRAARERELY